MRNTNDGSQNPPALRIDLSGGNLYTLPTYSSGPMGDDHVMLRAAKDAGFQGIQGGNIEVCRELGLAVTGSDRVDRPEDAERVAVTGTAQGMDCVTLHVGNGLEDDAEIDRLLDAILTASERHGMPLYIETHRATITQDMWRTVQFTNRYPDIRFNGDFSHWYTGLEMVYGDLEAKWAFLQPVFDRVSFLHGRIGNPGSIQVDIGDGEGLTYVDHFREMWTRSFVGFLKTAQPGDFIAFTPELLHPEIYYARLIPNAQGELVEEGDRWQQAQVYAGIARSCFAEAQRRIG